MNGGACCRFENGGHGCDRYNTRNGTRDKRSIQSSFLNSERKAGLVNIGGQSLEVYFQPHAFKHMDELGMLCYDISALSQFLLSVVPTLFIKSYGRINAAFIISRIGYGFKHRFTGFSPSKGALVYFDVSRNNTPARPAIVVYSVNLAQGPFDPQRNYFPRSRFINRGSDCRDSPRECDPALSEFRFNDTPQEGFSFAEEAFPALDAQPPPEPPPQLSVRIPTSAFDQTFSNTAITPPQQPPSFGQISPQGQAAKPRLSRSQRRNRRRKQSTQKAKQKSNAKSAKTSGGRRNSHRNLTRRYKK